MRSKKNFELIDYIMNKQGLYEEDVVGAENEPIADGTPSDFDSELEPTKDKKDIQEWLRKVSRRRRLYEEDKPCIGCEETDDEDTEEKDKKNGDEKMDKDSSPEAMNEWFYLYEEDQDEDVSGLSDEEALEDNKKTDADLAKEGGGQSPEAKLREARMLRRRARRLSEEAEEAAEKADKAEEKAEEAAEEDKKEEAEDLKEVAVMLRRKARRLREEAEEAAEKAEEKAEEADEEAAEEDEEKAEEEFKEEENAKEAVTEWARTVAYTGRRMLKEDKKRKLALELKRLIEEEEVGLGTPGQDLDAFGNDDDTPKRSSASAPTTEDELPD